MVKTELTKQQSRVYDYIVKYTTEHLYPPTLDEIGDALGHNKGVIYGHMATLERKGYIEREYGSSRAIQLVGFKLVKEGD